jgi:hypothetical protein
MSISLNNYFIKIKKLTKLNIKKMFMYIRTLNFLNQPSIIGFYSVVLETWLHWNKDTSIYNFIVNVIVRATSTFVNLNFHFFIKINYSNFIHYCFFFYHAGKEKKTYMLWLGFNKAKYFTMYTSCSGKTPSIWVALALYEPSLREVACV